jgi:ribose transport system ATP-binding protein
MSSTKEDHEGGETAAASAGPPLLEMRGIFKSFPGVKALINVGLTASAGEIHALMGENGAGKSTLIKIISGAYAADPGSEIRIDGAPVVIDSPAAAIAHGIAVIYQELSLSPNLTVAENVYLGREIRRGLLVDRRSANERCRHILDSLGADFSPTDTVSALSLAERQLVEIARAIHANVRILVMDEPTAALSLVESERLFALIQRLRGRGLAIVYVSHRMAEIARLADRVTVLRDGAVAGAIARADITHERVVRMMVGRDLVGFYQRESRRVPDAHDRPFFEVRDIGDSRRVHGCSFALRRGEILGIAGLVGSGRTELARLIFGADPKAGGQIMLDSKALEILSPRDAIASGIVYLTEDRKSLGLYLDMSVRDNINTMVLQRDAWFGAVLDFTRSKARARQAIKSLSIRTPSEGTWVGSLSGGNQQKVLLARLLQTRPRVLILDEPTRGVDIGAKSEIYRVIDELALDGMGIIFISSELPEIIGVAERVLVMRSGRIVGELDPRAGQPLSQEAIMALATSAGHESSPQEKP